MNTKLYQEACEALWGPQYQMEAGRQLGLSPRTAQRYASGERDVPTDILDKLQVKVGSRMIKLGMIQQRLARKAAAS